MSDRNCSCTCHDGGIRDPSCDRACFACGEAPSPLAPATAPIIGTQLRPFEDGVGFSTTHIQIKDTAQSPLARDAVKELYGRCADATDFFRENIGPVPEGRAAKLVTEEALTALLATISRVEAATESRVRAEVWGKAAEAVKFCSDTSSMRIRDAALADGVDLTSLAKNEL